MLIAFELSMPSNNAWNGKWSGDKTCYARVVNIGNARKTRAKYQGLIDRSPFLHHFGDGWTAAVSMREVDTIEARKLRKASRGFYGYDWMIDSIRTYDEILGDEKRHLRALANLGWQA